MLIPLTYTFVKAAYRVEGAMRFTKSSFRSAHHDGPALKYEVRELIEFLQALILMLLQDRPI